MERWRGRRRAPSLVLATISVMACAVPAQRDGAADPGTPRPYGPDPTVRIRVLVPEVYELANVVIAVSEHGRRHPWAVHRQGEYYRRVRAHFDPHAGHQLVRVLDPRIAASYRDYYGFRENAFSYVFDGDELVHAGRHFGVWPSPDLFARYLELVRDFADASGFRDFFASEASTYREQIRRYREMVDLSGMAGWLHSRFPGRRMNRYTVVFSPLILGSHSTRDFDVDGVREAVMFVSGPDVGPPGAADAIRRAGHERVVFTEIDHNYVNPITDAWAPEVRKVFRDWRAWNVGEGYASPILTFNEYMTWAVFTLYAADAYESPVFRETVARVERQMQESRGFVRFRAFNRELLRAYRDRPAAPVDELYPGILGWAAARFP